MFGGWYTTKSCEVGTRVRNTRDINTREYEDGSTIQLFAKWTKLINVTFDYGDTTKIISTQESFPDDPVKVDYVFNGWYTHKNGAGTRIYSFDEISSNITLYAYWTECTHEWSEWSTVNDPTCSSEGLEHRICNRCGKEETNPIDMLTGDACVIPEENS